jgi:1-acyl-sn-glycerol-3-phosphate acyltransferase
MLKFFLLNGFIAIQSIFLCLWGLLISAFDRNGRLVHAWGAVPWAKMILWVCGVKVDVRGQEHLNGEAPRIFLTNHQSYFDIIALLAHLPVDFKFVMKKELMGIPLLGVAMRRAGYIGIDRDHPREAVKGINEAVQKIENGSSLVIFPEGTRSEDGQLQPFKRGGFNLALKSGRDVVPVAIINSRDIVPKGSLRINKGTFAMIIGVPISVKEYAKKDIHQLMARVREAIINQMRDSH